MENTIGIADRLQSPSTNETILCALVKVYPGRLKDDALLSPLGLLLPRCARLPYSQ